MGEPRWSAPTRSRSSGRRAGSRRRRRSRSAGAASSRSWACAPDALIGVGVDRLDYTKGVEERLLAVERLLERFPTFRGRFTFVQLAAPSRTIIERYRQLNEDVERVAARVNERFGQGNYRPIVMLRSHHEPPAVFRYYRAADVCYVSSLHDGMNLVAKEYVAARDDERGVLVLSQFTGAARELTEALIVNPYDLDEASAALAAALNMSPEEQRDRMRAMRGFLCRLQRLSLGREDDRGRGATAKPRPSHGPPDRPHHERHRGGRRDEEHPRSRQP